MHSRPPQPWANGSVVAAHVSMAGRRGPLPGGGAVPRGAGHAPGGRGPVAGRRRDGRVAHGRTSDRFVSVVAFRKQK